MFNNISSTNDAYNAASAMPASRTHEAFQHGAMRPNTLDEQHSPPAWRSIFSSTNQNEQEENENTKTHSKSTNSTKQYTGKPAEHYQTKQ